MAVVRSRCVLLVLAALAWPAAAFSADQPTPRVGSGLQALYTFDEASGDIVHDRSGAGEPLHLRIQPSSAVRWQAGALEIRKPVLIASPGPAGELTAAVKKSGELTIEAWLQPANTSQAGPSRIVSLSPDPNQRNFTLGQEKDRYDVRLRTTGTDNNGMPSLASPKKTLATRLTHVVYTRDRGGQARIYIDGRRRGESKVGGSLENWDGKFRLLLANEQTRNRPWRGTLHLVAIYDRSLSEKEVAQNHAAGKDGGTILLARADTSDKRVSRDLQALYTFTEGKGNTVNDRSGAGSPLNLEIDKTDAVRWQNGSLAVRSSTVIASSGPANKISEAVKRTQQLSIEAWIKPGNTKQAGPSRIVTLSRDTAQRNFTLGQDGDRYDVRLRSTKTDSNGTPSTASPGDSLETKLTHVVYTRDSSGMARLYLNGQQRASRKVEGNLSNWSDSFQLAVANELTGDRPWQGELHLVAIFSRTLSAKEVQQNFAAGTGSAAPVAIVKNTPKPAPKPTPTPPAKPEPKPEPKPLPKPVVRVAAVSLPGGAKLEQVDFERHVMGLLSRMGCNSGSCHGSFQGQNGFRLSLFGHDPKMDHRELTNNDEGPRVDTDNPPDSYALLKATLQDEHGGGKRFDKDSWQYQVFMNWIATGAKWEQGSGEVKRIEVTPKQQHFTEPGQTAPLKVLAEFADGTQQDVTAFCDFRAADETIADITADGRLTGRQPGDTAIVVSYRGHVLASRALVAAPVKDGFKYPDVPETNGVDREVLAKLRRLNIVPADLSSDAEFLRRVYIDTIGRLPTPDELRSFFADRDPDKRNKQIDQLLADPAHAALWATRFGDITGNNTDALAQPREKRSAMWYDWFRTRLEKNVPYDQLVEGLLLATSRQGRKPDEWIKAARTIDEKALQSFDSSYPQRDTLDLFWSRSNFGLEQMAEQTAAAFLGIRLECAQCHKHPFDRWTQADYRSYANVFGQVKVGTSPDAKKAVDAENNRRKKIKDRKKRLDSLREVYLDAKGAKRLNDPDTNKPLPPTALGGPALADGDDHRRALLDWMRSPDNPFFARSFVNRVWAHYMGLGLVEPVDAFSVANPPSNEPLLDFLAREFIEHKFDIRHVERLILQSRTYQLSSVPNETNRLDRNNYARSYPRRMMAEVVVDVINSALGTSDEFTSDAPSGSRAIEVAGSRVRDGDLSYVFRIFGRSPRTAVCDCERSLDPALPQTLYLMTDSNLLKKISDGRLKKLLAEDNRLKRLEDNKLPDDELESLVEELFLATLSRSADETEQRAALEAVKNHDDPKEGLVDVMWALINTREFILNH